MEKVEKRLTKFRATLKSKRKLSLPVFLNQFQQQWAAEHGGGGSSNENLTDNTSPSRFTYTSVSSKYGSLSSIPQSFDDENQDEFEPPCRQRAASDFCTLTRSNTREDKFSPKRRNSRPNAKSTSRRNYSTLPNSSFSSVSSSSSGCSGAGLTTSNFRLPLKGTKNNNYQQYYVNPMHHHLVATVSSPGGTTSTTLILPKSIPGISRGE